MREIGQFLHLDFINYEGPARTLNFHQKSVLYVQNGFVCEVASCDDDTDCPGKCERCDLATNTCVDIPGCCDDDADSPGKCET